MVLSLEASIVALPTVEFAAPVLSETRFGTVAKALIMPSFYESLSLVTLESMAYGIPVIANKSCEVLKDHIESSQAGFLFTDFEDFKKALDTLFDSGTDLTTMREKATVYIAKNYTWPATLQKYKDAIDYVSPNV